MRMDLWVPTASPFATPELLAALGAEAEARGIGTIWIGEHVVLFDRYQSAYPYAADGKLPVPADAAGLLEPLSTLSFLAAHTKTVRLGTAMLLLPQRNPVYTAKEVATVDWLSGGRVDLGVGVGWLREEVEAAGVSWPRRGARADEYLDVLQVLWREPLSRFHGDFYELAACRMEPKPLQQPGVPVHVGGESDAALRRVARRGQGWHTFNRLPEELAAPLARLDELLAAEGRTRDEVRITVCPYFHELTSDRVSAYAEAGADAVAALCFATTPEEVPAALDALAPCLERAAAS